jgi:hypothetical protein
MNEDAPSNKAGFDSNLDDPQDTADSPELQALMAAI